MGQEERRSLWRGLDPFISPYSPNTFQDPPGPCREEEGQLPGMKKWPMASPGHSEGSEECAPTSPFLVLNLQLEAGVGPGGKGVETRAPSREQKCHPFSRGILSDQGFRTCLEAQGPPEVPLAAGNRMQFLSFFTLKR